MLDEKTKTDLYNLKGEIINLSLKFCAIQNKNIFVELMDAAKFMSLGEVTKCLFEVGGQYRRNM